MDLDAMRGVASRPKTRPLKYVLTADAHARLCAASVYTGRTMSEVLSTLLETHLPPAASLTSKRTGGKLQTTKK